SLPSIRGRQLFLLWKRTIPPSPASRRFPTPNRRPSQSSLPLGNPQGAPGGKGAGDPVRVAAAW
ncbi:hypothetical protein BKA56DRAFT_606158, partial [Ilyonectria sp. MPI-CAGE-AT-0026]